MTRPVRRALISVFDKTGIVELAARLRRLGVEIVSTGGTAAALRAEGMPVRDVSDVTGFPEILDGRVKTLHPNIHAGLLARRDAAAHVEALDANGIAPFDLVVVNLYPFENAVATGASADDTIELIDVGGPAMIRAAAKNHADVAVLVDPLDYAPLCVELEAGGGAISPGTRRRLAGKAFARTAAYDAAIARWMAGHASSESEAIATLRGTLVARLRYGENPHQRAAFYATSEPPRGLAAAQQLQGKELSYNNIADADCAWKCVADLDPRRPACVLVKHANPCGAALGRSLADAYTKALRCDPVSAFGGIVAFNTLLDEETANEVVKIFTEVIIAPAIDEAAARVIASKKNLRLIVMGDEVAPVDDEMRSVAGGFLLQSPDEGVLDDASLRCVTRRQPTASELADLRFAFAVAKHVKSNAIVFAGSEETLGIGAGQMSRIDSTRIAALKAAEAGGARGMPDLLRGSVVASDAFFPFPDGLDAAAEAGAVAAIQPGGSVNDADVIAAADRHGMAMLFTGRRHFRH
jgi:phosphoribosylaminoimidazolecarboxamide formyltransferase/IMP cyclohydrolase